MSNQYYLLAQLPSFSVTDDKSALPVTEEYFYDLCSRFLEKKDFELKELSSFLLYVAGLPAGSMELVHKY